VGPREARETPGIPREGAGSGLLAPSASVPPGPRVRGPATARHPSDRALPPSATRARATRRPSGTPSNVAHRPAPPGGEAGIVRFPTRAGRGGGWSGLQSVASPSHAGTQPR
jgi:hypothetical protein